MPAPGHEEEHFPEPEGIFPVLKLKMTEQYRIFLLLAVLWIFQKEENARLAERKEKCLRRKEKKEKNTYAKRLVVIIRLKKRLLVLPILRDFQAPINARR